MRISLLFVGISLLFFRISLLFVRFFLLLFFVPPFPPFSQKTPPPPLEAPSASLLEGMR